MIDASEYLGYEEEPQEGYMQPHKYRITCRCLRCGHEYNRVVSNLMSKNPPCPKKACKEAAIEEEVRKRLANAQAILESGDFPGVTGNRNVKIVDGVAEQVMSDYKLTDLRDNIRPGESMAPKLPPQMQKQADNFFGGANLGIGGRRMNALAKRALAGAFKGAAVAPTDIFPGAKGESALRRVS